MARPAPQVVLGCCTRLDDGLALLVHAERSALPAVPVSGEALAKDAERLAAELFGVAPPWLDQVAAFSDTGDLRVLFAAVVPTGTAAPAGYAWRPIGPRSDQWGRRVLDALRTRLDSEPIAFHLLPERFTLSELQAVYALLLERKLHKASFRRTLMAAHVVAPTDEWRSEGRGRPAQLFRYAPRHRRGSTRRAVRFEFRG